MDVLLGLVMLYLAWSFGAWGTAKRLAPSLGGQIGALFRACKRFVCTFVAQGRQALWI